MVVCSSFLVTPVPFTRTNARAKSCRSHQRTGREASRKREIFIDNLLVRVHLIIEISRPALRHGSLNSLFQVALYLCRSHQRTGREASTLIAASTRSRNKSRTASFDSSSSPPRACRLVCAPNPSWDPSLSSTVKFSTATRYRQLRGPYELL